MIVFLLPAVQNEAPKAPTVVLTIESSFSVASKSRSASTIEVAEVLTAFPERTGAPTGGETIESKWCNNLLAVSMEVVETLIVCSLSAVAKEVEWAPTGDKAVEGSPLPDVENDTSEPGRAFELDSSCLGAVIFLDAFSVVCNIRCASAREVAETLMVVSFPAVAKKVRAVGIINFLDRTSSPSLGGQVAAAPEISDSLLAVVKDTLGTALVVGKTVDLLKSS